MWPTTRFIGSLKWSVTLLFTGFVAWKNGGAGGNRTPVRESSADSSTYLAYYLI